MCNRWASSLQHISRLQADDTFDCKALVASIHAVSKARRWSLPLSLLWIHNRDCHHLDCVPTNAALAACGEGNAWATVLKLVQTIAESAMVPDEVSWGTAVSGFEQVARWQHSLHFLATHSSARTSDICCNSAASSCEKACNSAHGSGHCFSCFNSTSSRSPRRFHAVRQPLQSLKHPVGL